MIQKLLISIILMVGLVGCNLEVAPDGRNTPAPATDVQPVDQTGMMQTFTVETQQAQKTGVTTDAVGTEISDITPSLALTNTTTPLPALLFPTDTITPSAIFFPPPLPTAMEQDFNIEFVAFDNCSGMRFARLRLTNAGATTWESVEITLNDQATSTWSARMSADEFTDAYTCQTTSNKINLLPGENAIVYSQGFNHDLAHHPILANVTLCTQDGHVGQCLTKTIIFFSPLLTEAGFYVSYINSSICPENHYVLKFRLLNTGNVTWESMRLAVTDLDLNNAVSEDWDVFHAFNACSETNNGNLAPGGVVLTRSPVMHTDPTGHNCMAYFKLCTQDNLQGTCLEDTISFIP